MILQNLDILTGSVLVVFILSIFLAICIILYAVESVLAEKNDD